MKTSQNLKDMQKTPDNVDAIQIIKKDIPLKNEEMEAKEIDEEDKID